MELKRCDVQDLASTIVVAKSLIKFKMETSKGQSERQVEATEVGETRTSLLRKTNLIGTSGRTRRTKHQRSTIASYTMDLTEFLNILNGQACHPCLRRREATKR